MYPQVSLSTDTNHRVTPLGRELVHASLRAPSKIHKYIAYLSSWDFTVLSCMLLSSGIRRFAVHVSTAPSTSGARIFPGHNVITNVYISFIFLFYDVPAVAYVHMVALDVVL
jgi:hypothetical protein